MEKVNKSKKEQERSEEWNNMVNLERYHVMPEREILQRFNSKNPNSSRYMNTTDHAMMAWKNLEEPINEAEYEEDNDLFEDEEYKYENLKKDEEADDECSETSSSTDYVHLEQERIQRQHSIAWQHKDRAMVHPPKELE